MLLPQDPILLRFKKLQCKTLDQVQEWVAQERKLMVPKTTDNHGRTPTEPLTVCACQCLSYSCLAANAALSLLNVATYLLDRQVARLAQDFENVGGFTERLYKVRTEKRK